MERCTSSCLALQNREMSLTFSKWLTFGVHNAWETNKWPNGRLVRCAVVYSDNNFPKPIQRKQKGTSNVTNECRAQSSTSFNSVGGVSSPCRSTNFELSAHLITQVLQPKVVAFWINSVIFAHFWDTLHCLWSHCKHRDTTKYDRTCVTDKLYKNKNDLTILPPRISHLLQALILASMSR